MTGTSTGFTEDFARKTWWKQIQYPFFVAGENPMNITIKLHKNPKKSQ
jgi:hypothetical protein